MKRVYAIMLSVVLSVLSINCVFANDNESPNENVALSEEAENIQFVSASNISSCVIDIYKKINECFINYTSQTDNINFGFYKGE